MALTGVRELMKRVERLEAELAPPEPLTIHVILPGDPWPENPGTILRLHPHGTPDTAQFPPGPSLPAESPTLAPPAPSLAATATPVAPEPRSLNPEPERREKAGGSGVPMKSLGVPGYRRAPRDPNEDYG